MAVGDTTTLYGWPRSIVQDAVARHAYRTGTKWRSRAVKLASGSQCVEVLRLRDDGFHPDPSKDPEGPGYALAKGGVMPRGYSGPWPFQGLRVGQSVVCDEREYNVRFFERIKAAVARANAKGPQHYSVKFTRKGDTVLSCTITRDG